MNYLQKGVMYFALGLGSLGLLGQSSAGSLEEKVGNFRRVSVVGSAQTSVAPDEAIIRLGVRTEKKELVDAQQENAGFATNVYAALKANGVGEKDIETASYSVERVGHWESGTNRHVYTGYQVTNSLKVKTANLDNVGTLVDVAVKAGANDIDGITFGLTQESTDKLKYKLLSAACKDAKAKAQVMAASVDSQLGDVVSINESNYQVSRPDYDYAKTKNLAGEASTPVRPQNIFTSATVSVVFEIHCFKLFTDPKNNPG